MKYSYIKPRAKNAITPEVKLVLTFFGMTLLMILFTYAFLLFKDYAFERDLSEIKRDSASVKIKLTQMKEQIVFIEKENALAQGVQTRNLVLKDSITNLFDLVPSRITLSQAKLDKNSLILQGVTPNKDVYNFMLQAPLRSIFHRTYSSFYPTENGWLSFVSTNYIDEESSTQEEEPISEN